MKRFLILMYHSIDLPRGDKDARYACPPRLFDRHMRLLRARGYMPVSLDDISSHLRLGHTIPDHAVAVTLDDGFRDNHDHALPILLEHQVPATIFLATGQVGGSNSWMQARDYPIREMLSWSQIRAMTDAGVSFGGHTVTHPRLIDLDPQTALREIADSKQAIEDHTGCAVRHFAYPYGLLNPQVRDLVERAGFETACTTRAGFNRPDIDHFLLRRIEVYGQDRAWQVAQKLRFGANESSPLQPLRYYWKRVRQRLLDID